MINSIILAAGEGTRMKSKIPKVLHKVCGKYLLDYVIEAARGAGVDQNIVVVGHGGDKVREVIAYDDLKIVNQPVGEGVPYGTGFAVMQAKDYIKDDSYVIILYGDTPLITKDTINMLMKFHVDEDYDATVLTADFEDPTGYGRIIRDATGNVISIVEHKDATEEEKRIKEINSGIYCFKGKNLKIVLDKLGNNNAQGEYYITDAIEILNKLGCKVGAYKINNPVEILGVNSRVQLAEVEKIMRKRINDSFLSQGVTMIDPSTTYIEKGVKIGTDTIIYPGVIIEGNTVIGDNCVIGHNTKIVNSNIGNNVEIEISTILDSYVGNDTKIGPYAYLRPNSKIGNHVKIGDFVEVKNSTIGNNTKASHLSYIGDAEVGENVNIGCGVVFVNYNGKVKNKTIVEDNAFIGSNSNLVAPVIVKKDGYVAAGSTITDEVKEGELSIARARQVNKSGWVERKGLLRR